MRVPREAVSNPNAINLHKYPKGESIHHKYCSPYFQHSGPINFAAIKMSVVEVRVPNLDCEGCAGKLRKALFKLKGVEEVEVEMEAQKITVRGYALEEKKVVKAIKRAGKAAEPWPYPGHSYFSSFYKYPSHVINHYYYDSTTNVASPTVHAFFHTPAVYSVASLFSDDNPHACSLM